MEFSIKHSQDADHKGNFYLEKAQKKIAHIDYRMENGTLVVEHTEVTPSFQGMGAGQQLVDKIINFAASENLELKSECDYFSHQWEKMK